MYLTVDLPLFIEVFQKQRPDDFSLEGLEELYDHLTDLEQVDDRAIKLDVVEITSTYAEVTIQQFNEDFQVEADDMEDLMKFEPFIAKIDDDRAIVKTDY